MRRSTAVDMHNAATLRAGTMVDRGVSGQLNRLLLRARTLGFDCALGSSGVVIHPMGKHGVPILVTTVGKCSVAFGALEHDIPDLEVAIDLADKVMRGICRVVVTRQGAAITRCELQERQSDQQWSVVLVSGSVGLFTWWKSTSTEIYVNEVQRPSEAERETATAEICS